MRPSSRILLLAATCALPVASQTGRAAQDVPVVDLPRATVRTRTTLGGVIGVREVGGAVLVNDASRRQLLLYDTTLSASQVVLDSVEGMPNSYGRFGVPLVPHVGDSSLMADLSSGPGTLLVLDARGRVARSFALPNALDVSAFASGTGGVDNRGRILYRAGNYVRMPPAGTVGAQEVFVDSSPLLRADVDARRVDTIGRVSRNSSEHTRIDRTDPKKVVRTVVINPLPAPDEWAVLSDGSVAIVRGRDYRIDWIRPDGATSSTRLPFDWKRVSDGDKRKLIDSARATFTAPGNAWAPPSLEVVAPTDIPDYYPAIREGAAMADLDNRLWVLPTTSSRSRRGELVYDVVSAKGELVQRVRLPMGRFIAGFGRNGVVYMLVGSKAAGFHLERTRLRAARR